MTGLPLPLTICWIQKITKEKDRHSCCFSVPSRIFLNISVFDEYYYSSLIIFLILFSPTMINMAN